MSGRHALTALLAVCDEMRGRLDEIDSEFVGMPIPEREAKEFNRILRSLEQVGVTMQVVRGWP